MRSERDFMLLTPPEKSGDLYVFGCRIILIPDECIEIRSMIVGVGPGLRVVKVAWSILCI